MRSSNADAAMQHNFAQYPESEKPGALLAPPGSWRMATADCGVSAAGGNYRLVEVGRMRAKARRFALVSPILA